MIRLYHIGLTWVCVLIISLAGTLWVNGEEELKDEEKMELNAKAAVLLDGHTGRVLYGKNEKIQLPMASTTKIMTCLIALENSNPNDPVVFSDYAASMPDVQLNAVSGDMFYMKDLLYALMLESHNDVAVAIAEHIGKTEKEFAEMMNERAKEIGCAYTNFVTANGLDELNHYTTAEELGLITIEALKNEQFVKIINTSSYQFSTIDGKKNYQINNKNKFLQMMSGAYGVKTGFTNQAGYCFVGAIEYEGESYVSVVLGSGWPPNQNWKWDDTKKLVEYGLENYELQRNEEKLEAVGELFVDNGIENSVALVAELKNDKFLINKEEKYVIHAIQDLKRNAPVLDNDIIGWVYGMVDDVIIEKAPVFAEKTVKKKTYGYCLFKTMELWMKL